MRPRCTTHARYVAAPGYPARLRLLTFPSFVLSLELGQAQQVVVGSTVDHLVDLVPHFAGRSVASLGHSLHLAVASLIPGLCILFLGLALNALLGN